MGRRREPWPAAMSCLSHYLAAVTRVVCEDMILIALSLCLLPVRASLHEAIDTYIIQTELGNIRGYSKIVMEKKLYIFSGIPYAKPPIGRRRFRKPSPVSPWEGILDGTKLPNTCVQEKYEFFPGFSGKEVRLNLFLISFY